ncbi:MAG: acyl carrier protein [Acidobacteria bacterium]|nr:acyl carrier protein [Acidobacteriota bacterium]
MTTDPGPAIERILHRFSNHASLDPTLPLGAHGLALDSIAIVEVLMACEEQFGVTIAADLLAGEPLTVGGLVAAVEEARLKAS